MTPDETLTLLRVISSVDPWFKTVTVEEAADMRAGWANLLVDVPYGFAEAHARRHYRRAGARSIQPGDLVEGWRNQRRRDDDRAPRLPLEREGAHGKPEWFDKYAADCTAAVRAGGKTTDVPLPYVPRSMAPEDRIVDDFERRCRHHAICACSHTECRDGWLDAEQPDRRRHQPVDRTVVAACPHCHDAAVMAADAAPTRGRGYR